jgi:hypothetical protein
MVPSVWLKASLVKTEPISKHAKYCKVSWGMLRLSPQTL